MAQCDSCGFPLPDGSEYCPNCGAPVRKEAEVSLLPAAPVAKILQAAALGALLSVMISTLSPSDVQLYFIPSFISSLVSIYLFRSRRLHESVTIALGVYLFADALLGGLIFGSIYMQHIPLAEAYGDYMLTLADVVMYISNPITAVAAGYIGNRLTSKTGIGKPSRYTYRREEERGGVVYSL